MTEAVALSRAMLVAAVVVWSACGGDAKRAQAPRTSVPVGIGHPALAVLEREGDGLGAVALAVNTEGIAPDRGAVVAVALGALVRERLTARGIAEVSAVGGMSGWRLRALVASPSDAAKLVGLARDALLGPVLSGDGALPAVAMAVAGLARHPTGDHALLDVARCTGAAFAKGDETAPTATDLETWRRAAHGVGRVAIATAGNPYLADAVADALARTPKWPTAAAVADTPWPAAEAPAVVYDASGELPAGAARVVVMAYTTTPERAVAASPALGDPSGALASRLAALDAPSHVRSVVAAAHADGGCLAATFDLWPGDLTGSDAPARIAAAAVLARQEVTVEISDTAVSADLREDLARHATDPRDAAERAAWWELSGKRRGRDEQRTAIVVGVAAAREQAVPKGGKAADPPVQPALGAAIADEIERASAAWRTPAVEARTRIEHGQAEAWVLLASTCGTTPESAQDDGSGAAVALAAAMQGESDASGARLEPFVASDGIGVLAHGPARDGEQPQAHVRRLADLAGRAFAADGLDTDRVARARAALLSRAADGEAHSLASLAAVLAPGHPSWIDPLGTRLGLESSSDDAIALRASALRDGPLRVAVLANADQAQANAAVQAVDRWIARRPGETRSCPPTPRLAAIAPGTYAVEAPPRAPSEAFLAFPLGPDDEGARAQAPWIAAMLDGPNGLLARALGPAKAGDPPHAALALSCGASLVGAPRSPALVIHLVADDAVLDAAVAQTRALLDRVRWGALSEQDRSRAISVLARAGAAASLDPRARAIRLWRGDPPQATPSLDLLRAFAAASMHDETMIIVAVRPARAGAEANPSHESKPSRRESSGR